MMVSLIIIAISIFLLERDFLIAIMLTFGAFSLFITIIKLFLG